VAELSLAAQAILDAYGDFEAADTDAMAAALRAAVDQVVPEDMDLPPIAPDLGHFRQNERRLTRQRILAIVAELDNCQLTREGGFDA
jgi:hypothetical protein